MTLTRDLLTTTRRRQRGLRGGSDGEAAKANGETTLREQVRHALRHGTLPLLLSQRVWVGPGSGQACAVCGQAIATDELEHEVEVGASRLAHGVCARVWRDESAQLQSDSATGS